MGDEKHTGATNVLLLAQSLQDIMEGAMENRVNERSLEEELKRIDDFFNNISDEEFVEMIERNGSNEIKESCESSFVIAAQPFMCFKSHLRKD